MMFDIAHVLTDDSQFPEDTVYLLSKQATTSEAVAQSIPVGSLREHTLFSIVCSNSPMYYALILEPDAQHIVIFDGVHGLEKRVAGAVEEHYHHTCIEVEPSILFASVVARAKQEKGD